MSSIAAKADTMLSPAQASPIPQIEVLDREERRSDWSTFHRIRYRLRASTGAWIIQEREFLDRGDAVALLPFCPETGNVLLTRQFRMPIYVKRPEESMLLEVCGGILDDPDPENTVRHEAVEEIGLELGDVQKVFEAYSTPGSVCEKVHFFVATYSPGQRLHPGGGAEHEPEDIEILEMPLSRAIELIRQNKILDARTVALVFYLASQGLGTPAT